MKTEQLRIISCKSKAMGGAMEAIISAASLLVFAFLDLLDFALCFLYRFLDLVLEENPIPCCSRKEHGIACGNGGEGEISDTLFERSSIFGELRLSYPKESIFDQKERKCGRRSPRWSDCSCERCVSWQYWQGKGKEKLHLVIREPSQAGSQDVSRGQPESVIFLHGFLSSSSIWVETVFPNLSEDTNLRARMFAVDLLGFGNSPKPANCLYTIEDHLEMIERTVIRQFHLESFHIVAHSMGCILALALAAKHPKSVKSITLVAPPYMSSNEAKASHNALNILAERKIWPPLLFCTSVMSWYEHLGRTICFILCRNHSTWEWIIKLLTRKKHLPFTVTDFTKHTHHSAWNTMHNVLCGGAKLMDKYLEALREEGIFLKIIQGTKDHVVPLECSRNMKAKVPQAELQLITGAGHSTAILGRKKAFTRDLEGTWSSTQSAKPCFVL